MATTSDTAVSQLNELVSQLVPGEPVTEEQVFQLKQVVVALQQPAPEPSTEAPTEQPAEQAADDESSKKKS